MTWTVFAIVIYGLFTVAGGVIGYLKAKSRASLIVGSLTGIVLLAAAFRMQQGNPAAPVVVIVVSLLLGGRFAATWWNNRRFAPDLLMVFLSVTALLAAGFEIAARP